ncbi:MULTISPECIES: Ohr family peroxiredoxin [Thermomonospora]|uniref:Ohr subfamily peroxiredoxin n=1 Tax=Thermomonospora cellulosilytica TaxID=1411118 RepID=A0A7W3R8W2_9ACTN|nr:MULTISPECIES: Ohr family peroxiredoxin [Thermomonospora]MBA9004156.1 Ohr subfamily peroxiredoxin [Thermomonospora cellulosilytica]
MDSATAPDYERLYVARATSRGGRDDRVVSDDGALDVALKAPPELGGTGGASNPEQLMAAAYAACFHSALTLVASRQGVDPEADVQAEVALLKRNRADDYRIALAVRAHMPNVDRATAERVVGQAFDECPYTTAFRENTEINVQVT